MKLFSLVLVAVSTASVRAVECPPGTMTAVESTPEYKAFERLLCLGAPTKSCPAEENECFQALAAVYKTLPDCTVQGIDPKYPFATRMESMQRACGGASTATTPPPSTATATAPIDSISNNTAPAPSTTTPAVSSTAVALLAPAMVAVIAVAAAANAV